jgi:hypothetical protein
MDDQNEIARLRKEIVRLQGLLNQRTTTTLRPTQSDTTPLIENHELITDCCRYSEGLMDEAAVRKKWRLSEDVYTRLGENEAFIEAVEAERICRTRSGATARERAQVLFTTAPATLGTILNNESMSARHRIEASKELRQIAVGGSEAQPTEERFSIVINLGEDHKLVIDKPIRPTPSNDEVVEQELIPMIAASKQKDNGGGEPL